MSNKRAKTTEEKENFNKKNKNLVTLLDKHVHDWYNDHPGVSFITPRDFQNAYPQWDKYSNESFRSAFYIIKKRIEKCEFSFLLS